ncbi:hypothetical protein TNCV_1677761 [Trichonephila clavipes]|nr:hypothetical protein TNCV_1677761 [Trichonephila clavipes]
MLKTILELLRQNTVQSRSLTSSTSLNCFPFQLLIIRIVKNLTEPDRESRVDEEKELCCYLSKTVIHQSCMGWCPMTCSFTLTITRLILAMFSSFPSVEEPSGRSMSSVDIMPDLNRKTISRPVILLKPRH